MNETAYTFEEFETRAGAADAAADAIIAGLTAGLSGGGTASLMVSGGSTPGPVFDRLSDAVLDWQNVTLGLVDERWVDPESSASNENLVRRHLHRNQAAAAAFLPMWAPGMSAAQAAEKQSDAYRPHCQPINVVLLGMGGDGHTASWFPGAVNLADAVGSDVTRTVAYIDASGCPVAGANIERLTLTLPAIARAEHAILLINGMEKRGVLTAAIMGEPDEFPVRYAIDALGSRLTIYWAP